MPTTRTGTRLDAALGALHPGMSRRKAREVIEKGQVTVDGTSVLEAGRAVDAGARIAWDPNRRALPRARLSLPKLYEDEHLLIVDKPAGLLSVPTSGAAAEAEDTVLARVTDYVRRLRPRAPYVGRVHRLDRETSGALVVALTPEARAGLIHLFREHRIERVYDALVAGVPRDDASTVDAPIRDTWMRGRRGVARGEEPASRARTHWRVVERLGQAARLAIRLETGRQHQIRAHLAHVGLPILGDRVYARQRSWPGPAVKRPMLHACRLAFLHPVTGRTVAVLSPTPADFARTLDALRHAARRQR
jgi:23S rRNA pseudouridine1911/1915/1917 synthase